MPVNPRRYFQSFRWAQQSPADRKSTRLNSSHSQISYAVFCLKKKILYSIVQVLNIQSLIQKTFHPLVFLVNMLAYLTGHQTANSLFWMVNIHCSLSVLLIVDNNNY